MTRKGRAGRVLMFVLVLVVLGVLAVAFLFAVWRHHSPIEEMTRLGGWKLWRAIVLPDGQRAVSPFFPPSVISSDEDTVRGWGLLWACFAEGAAADGAADGLPMHEGAAVDELLATPARFVRACIEALRHRERLADFRLGRDPDSNLIVQGCWEGYYTCGPVFLMMTEDTQEPAAPQATRGPSRTRPLLDARSVALIDLVLLRAFTGKEVADLPVLGSAGRPPLLEDAPSEGGLHPYQKMEAEAFAWLDWYDGGMTTSLPPLIEYELHRGEYRDQFGRPFSMDPEDLEGLPLHSGRPPQEGQVPEAD